MYDCVFYNDFKSKLHNWWGVKNVRDGGNSFGGSKLAGGWVITPPENLLAGVNFFYPPQNLSMR